MPRIPAIASAPSSCLVTLVAVTTAWVGLDHGGYFPPVWGWSGLAFGWVAVVSFALRSKIAWSRLELVFTGGLALMTAWSAVSLAWTPDTTVGVENVERDLVYVGAALVAVSLGDRFAASALRNAVLFGSSIVCVYSLGTRLFLDRLGFFSDVYTPGRLFNPLGYWNAQGVLAVLSMLLAAGVAASRGRKCYRSFAAGLLPLLAVDCYFTLSRGALIALAIGVAVWLAIDPGRLRSSVWLLILSPWPALATWRAHGMSRLFGDAFNLHSAPAGHRLALQVVACAVVEVAVVGAVSNAEGRLKFPRWMKIAYAGSWVVAVLLVVTLAVVRYETPAQMTRAAYAALTAPPPSDSKSTRLLSLSLNGRAWLWSVAWSDAKAHPIAGSGIGSYEQIWLKERPLPSDARWAHSLYLETFAEVGVVGLLFVLVALAAPLVAAVRCRSSPVIPALSGAYVAYLVHAGIDWDWQVPALTLVALWCGCAILAAEDGLSARRWVGSRGIAVAAAGAVGVLAALGLAGSRDLALSHSAGTRGAYAQAAAAASAAARWQPWSYLPDMALGDARWASGDIAGARVAFRRAVERDPGRWDAWFALAETSSGREQEKAIRQAAQLDPLSRQVSSFCVTHDTRGCDSAPSN